MVGGGGGGAYYQREYYALKMIWLIFGRSFASENIIALLMRVSLGWWLFTVNG